MFAVVTFCAGPAAADPWKWGPSIDFEVKPGTERHLGEVDLFAPLAQSDVTLLFGNMRARFDDNDSAEGNFGIGVRHMLASGWNIGAFGYYDRRRTDFDNIFNQVTLGFEALGRDFDFRANAYLPFGDTFQGDAVSGGLSVADLVGSTVQVTTSGGTLTGEQALTGFDGEVGWRVPVWQEKLDKVMRLYAGMFHFEGENVDDVTGPRLRAELTMYDVPGLWDGARLTFGAEYQWDDVRGSQAFAMARLRIPLQKDTGASSLSMQELRMTERVVRDVDVVTGESSEELAAIVETATETAGGSAITVIDDATTTGADLPGEVSGAGANSTVILTGTFNTNFGLNVQSGQTVMGAGTVDVRTATGRTATLTTPGAAISGANDNILSLAAGSTASGLTLNLTISAAGSFAAVGMHHAGATLTGNTISVSNTMGVGGGTGVAISGDGSSVENNVITVTGNAASVESAVGVAANTTNVTVSGNTLNASGGTISNAVRGDVGSSFAAGSTDNVLVNGTCEDNGIASGFVGFTNGTTCP